MEKQVKNDVHIAEQHSGNISKAAELAGKSKKIICDEITTLSVHQTAKSVIKETESLVEELAGTIATYSKHILDAAEELARTEASTAKAIGGIGQGVASGLSNGIDVINEGAKKSKK